MKRACLGSQSGTTDAQKWAMHHRSVDTMELVCEFAILKPLLEKFIL
jgi:hypothetical protein